MDRERMKAFHCVVGELETDTKGYPDISRRRTAMRSWRETDHAMMPAWILAGNVHILCRRAR